MGVRTTPPFRADHVGSFLRPSQLLDARERFRRGEIGRAQLRAVEDSAISDIVRFQEDLGLSGITDGEFRRTYFHIDFLEQLDGVETRGGIAVSFHSAQGNVDFAPPVMHITGPVRHVHSIQVDDFNFLRSVTRRTPKVTIPSPTMLHFRGGRDAISREAYPDLEAFYADVAAAYRAEIAALAAAAAATCNSTTRISRTCATRRCERVRGRAATIRTSCRGAMRGSSMRRSRTDRPT